MLSGTCKPLAGLVLAALVSLGGIARGQTGGRPDLMFDPSNPDAELTAPDERSGDLVKGSPAGYGGKVVAVDAPPGDLPEGIGPGTPAPAPVPVPADEPGRPWPGDCRPPNGPPCPPDWLEHPLSVGWFLGAVQGSPLIEDWVGMDRGVYGGVRVGFDHDANLGLGNAVRHVLRGARSIASRRLGPPISLLSFPPRTATPTCSNGTST